VENIDLPRTMIDINLQEVAYQTALSSAARVLQPSLIEFLR
jgi:flagellar hook-associated protein 3 FlgL